MAGKPQKPAAAEKPAAKSKKPHFKGINHPRNLDKGFRVHGNRKLIRAALDRQRRKPVAMEATDK